MTQTQLRSERSPEVKRRRLASLEPAIIEFTTKAWYTHPHAKPTHGADPNAPREPRGSLHSNPERLAARAIDATLGGRVALLGFCDCDQSNPDDSQCPHSGTPETEPERSLRLRRLLDVYPKLKAAVAHGVGGVYDLAQLRPAERACVALQHEGHSHQGIADLTGRQKGTVKALLSRAHFRLRALVTGFETAAVEYTDELEEAA